MEQIIIEYMTRFRILLKEIQQDIIEVVNQLGEREDGISNRAYRTTFLPQITRMVEGRSREIQQFLSDVAISYYDWLSFTREVTDEYLATATFLGNTIEQWTSEVVKRLNDSLSFTTFPGRSKSSTLLSIERALTDPSYPNSPITFVSLLLRGIINQSNRDYHVFNALRSGRSRIFLRYNNDGNEECRALQGEYDVRFIPEVTIANCTCVVEEREDEPMEYPQKVYVDGEPVLIPTEKDIEDKEEQIKEVANLESSDIYLPLLRSELDFMREVYNSFATDRYSAGRTRDGRNTVSFGDEIEILAQHIYGGKLTTVKAPLDIIHPIFGIETKSSTAKERSTQERGHIAGREVVRKYQYIERLVEEERTLGYPKYVLGVFDLDRDRVTLYEQNYWSNKNSATMIPVAIVNNYSQIQWIYESTPFREFKVVGLEESTVEVILLRNKQELENPFYWEVVRAHRANLTDGDRVEYFDGETVRKGRIYDESVSEEDRQMAEENWNKYHLNFPRRGTYALPANKQILRTYLENGEVTDASSVFFHSEWSRLSGIVLEFKNLHHQPGYDLIGDVYYVDNLPIYRMSSAFLTVDEFKEFRPLFRQAGLILRPVDSKRRNRRVTRDGRHEYDVIYYNPAFANGPVIRWENGEIETVSYNDFNRRYRLLVQGAVETLEERGLAVENEEEFYLTEEMKQEIIKEAETVLIKFS